VNYVSELKNRTVNMILRYMGEERKQMMEEFVNNMQERDYVTFSNNEEILTFFDEFLKDFFANATEEEIEILHYYTGISFREINSVLRNTWNYEYNGLLTEKRKQESIKMAGKIKQAITKVESLPDNIKVYRGVSLSSFLEYGVSSLDDLLNLKGEYYYDYGFVSTSLLRQASFFNRDLEWHEDCNIEIEYLIPEECQDALPLITEELSYSPVQVEFLIQSGNLSKITDVVIDKENNKGYIQMAFVPHRVWDKVYDEKMSEEDNLKM
jgi:hypothetical protein